ncbi:hypothetical protein TH63_16470 [Rufibacter radiotolerans]|uniref:PH domain-containing protein n=1 Tax=Rufibacter radiotolerans TaxID=1379910 RepID=A0A0H4VM09_9BACT|nr:hypothetical protein [Rufibacter radiotolerans]AKQ46865.1 hypothetical protein TH63_16470 [Rufibacter radiotolerans]
MLGVLLKITAVIIVVQYLVRFFSKFFNKQQRVFFLSPMRQFKKVFWSLLSAWLGGSMISLLARDQSVTPLERSIAIGLGVVLFLFALPTLLLHFQYWRHERENALELEKETNTALLLQPGGRYLLNQQQIQHILETRCPSRRYFWSSYHYLTLTLADGQQVIITSLLIDLELLKALWPRVPHQTRTKWACFL